MKNIPRWGAAAVAALVILAACGSADAGPSPVEQSLADIQVVAGDAAVTADAALAAAEKAQTLLEEQSGLVESALADLEERLAEASVAEPVDVEEHVAGAPAHWGYEGAGAPEHWASLDSEFALCEAGVQQSPIDIATPSTFGVGLDDLSLEWQPSDITIVDNGHSIQANVAPGNTTVIDGVTYDLLQFHFHKPSEHTVDSEVFPMELHFVHADAAGHLAVVGVLLEQGPANPAYDVLWSAQPDEGVESAVASFDLRSLLPGDLGRYRYSGSLTTPPCSEGVNWNVLAQPGTLSAEQIAAFAYDGNARPVQGVGSRSVLRDDT